MTRHTDQRRERIASLVSRHFLDVIDGKPVYRLVEYMAVSDSGYVLPESDNAGSREFLGLPALNNPREGHRVLKGSTGRPAKPTRSASTESPNPSFSTERSE